MNTSIMLHLVVRNLFVQHVRMLLRFGFIVGTIMLFVNFLVNVNVLCFAMSQTHFSHVSVLQFFVSGFRVYVFDNVELF